VKLSVCLVPHSIQEPHNQKIKKKTASYCTFKWSNGAFKFSMRYKNISNQDDLSTLARQSEIYLF
jgi:hypothetical protein